IFGPVVNILTYSDDEEVMARVNDTEMGLCGSVFSQDIGRANRFAERIQAGMIWMNTGPILDGPSPWGGYKQSGIGREMG
ncbi:aldehyde dehydrogenase family protein, partial [Bacillus sp. SIMBA_033]